MKPNRRPSSFWKSPPDSSPDETKNVAQAKGREAALIQGLSDHLFARATSTLETYIKRAHREKIQVLLAGDLPGDREELRRLLEAEADIALVGVVENNETLVPQAVETNPDVVLLDIAKRYPDNLDICEQLSRRLPATPIIVASVFGDEEFIKQAMTAGAKYFLVKPFSRDELMKAIQQGTGLEGAGSRTKLLPPWFGQGGSLLKRIQKQQQASESFPAGPDKIRLLIVDDVSETRENLRKLLYFEPDIEVVGVAAAGRDGIEMALALQPDIILMDIGMPGVDGVTASEEISRRVPSCQIIMMSVHGEADYFHRSMLAGAREFLIKPFSSEALLNSVRRVYQLGVGLADLKQREVEGAARYFKLYKLGRYVELSLAVTDLVASLAFYQTLGLEQVDGGQTPYPWAVVSDGAFYLGLHQQAFSSPTLTYFKIDVSTAVYFLEKLGATFDAVEEYGGRLEDENKRIFFADFRAYEEQRVVLADKFIRAARLTPRRRQFFSHYDAARLTPKRRQFFSHYDKFSELSLPTADMDAAVAHWRRFGFERVNGGDEPYPWTVLSDGLIHLGFHQTPTFTQPTLTRFAPDMPDRLDCLRQKGVAFIAERKDKAGRRIGAAIESPDGQPFFLFSGG